MEFYSRICDKQQYDKELEKCIFQVVSKLEETTTSTDSPGVLLGKIQSGKTRGFLGIIAKAFDHNYDIALVLTKGTKTLAKQTVSRIKNDFKDFIENDELSIFDIMEMPDRLTRSEINKKIIIVAKKEIKNLERLKAFFEKENHTGILDKKIILIDDEADMGSIRFVRKKTQGSKNGTIEQGKIAQKMDELRILVKNMRFLQVTATPYSLYLQPENYSNPFLFLPKKPAFTELLPIHNRYVGGDDYFGEYNSYDPRCYLYVRVTEDEQEALRSKNEIDFSPETILSISGISTLKKAIVSFLIAVAIRRWQQRLAGEKQSKYAMIIHNDTQRKSHEKQWNIVEALREAFEKCVSEENPVLSTLFDNSFDEIKTSVICNKDKCPEREEAFELYKQLISDGEINVQRVNSDVELASLLDPATAELRLRTEANIFIGGSLLDRGITIPNLISFYYGRNPKKMQADTVLQHSRMYGARDRKDLAVTRFYTSQAVFNRLKHVHEFDSALRKAFENGDSESGVVFIENDASQGVIPCAPSKVSISRVVTVNSGGYYLPAGFELSNSIVKNTLTEKVNDILLPLIKKNNKGLLSIPKSTVFSALDIIKKSLVLNNNEDFYWDAMYGLVDYYCKSTNDDTIKILIEENRELTKDRSGDKSGLSIVGGKKIRELLSQQRSQPAMVFLKQKGGIDKGWNIDSEFWWPILIAPTTSSPCIYSMP
ncbi:hypothetical protein HAP49_02585 [Serratia marcescens]|uniref:Z1 domain-containing protein n=1 Tax=Serratia marcescens TaxID=615 RepID=UPI000ACB5330|nr:Z1 domain-containing protein [Serratia marcescens]MDM8342071.1 Z1 domain-containing protein [Serratia marcescens]QIO26063.1 hypothetical protein HAP49_02585 [Serratia marcescens]HCR2979373.1 hypothetical protein [Serratia marcescens]